MLLVAQAQHVGEFFTCQSRNRRAIPFTVTKRQTSADGMSDAATDVAAGATICQLDRQGSRRDLPP